MSKHWYAIYTKPNQEERAEQGLRNQDLCVYLPRLQVRRQLRREWVDAIESMFPRYLFVELDINEENIAPIRSIPGIANIVRFTDSPAIVPRYFVELLQQTEEPDKQCHSKVLDTFFPDSGVAVADDTLMDLQAVMTCESGDERAIFLLNLLARENEALEQGYPPIPDE